MYYRTHHPKMWTSAVLRLEEEQPLLKLCASNWKAEHTLGNSIQAILSKEYYGKRSKKRQNKGKETEKRNMASVGSDDSGDGHGAGKNLMSCYTPKVITNYISAGDMASSYRQTSPPQGTSGHVSNSEFFFVIDLSTT